MKNFSLLVKPTSADCNLRCTYCFYLEKCALYPDHKVHRMNDLVVERMIKTFMETPQSAHAFGWQGGEPTLMGVEFFERVIALQKQYGQAGASVSNGLQTNGTLLNDEWGKHLARYNYLLGVSVDGPAAVHDASRPNVAGKGSHAMVMEGIDALKRNGVEHNILTLVTQTNVHRPKETYHYVRDELGELFHQYIECVEFDEEGALAPYAISGQEWGDFLCGIYDEWIRCKDTHTVSIRLFDSILMRMVHGVANVCAMGQDCRQYLVVEYNGDIYPCDFFVEPRWKLGNILEHSWDDMLESALYQEFGARKREWNAACSTCEFLRLCGGCCPKNRPGHGEDPRQLSHLCSGWKQFFRHTRRGFESLANEIRSGRTQRAPDPMPPRRPDPASRSTQPGRNSPCPCGSGKRYKRCCGKK